MGRGGGHDNPLTKRGTHRGFILANNAAEQVVAMYASNYAVKAIERHGAPTKLYWPVMSDFQGAMLLIDAVMDRDYESIVRLNARYPEFDFQLGNWFVELKTEYERKGRVHRKQLKRQLLANGLAYVVELETDMDTGARAICRALFRGKKLLARDTIVSDTEMTVDADKKVETAPAPAKLRTTKPKPAKQKPAAPPAPEPEELQADPALATTSAANTAKA